MLFFLKVLPTNLKFFPLIHGTSLQQLLLQCSKGDFLFPSFLSIYYLEIFCREDVPLISHLQYLLIYYLYLYGFLDIYS